MNRFTLLVVGAALAVVPVFGQAPSDAIDRALGAAPRQLKDGAMVIKWKADGTYDTLRPGTNRLVCYDQSGEPNEQPVSIQCTSVGNLERVKQNKMFEKELDRVFKEDDEWDMDGLDLTFDAKAGVVTITGDAPTQAAKDKVGERVRAVSGVKDVVNDLEVKTPRAKG